MAASPGVGLEARTEAGKAGCHDGEEPRLQHGTAGSPFQVITLPRDLGQVRGPLGGVGPVPASLLRKAPLGELGMPCQTLMGLG